MLFIKVLPICVLFVFGVSLCDGKESGGVYKIRKIDVSDPACKYLISELVSIDRRLLNITSFSPTLTKMADKYKPPETRRRRDLASLASVLNNETIKQLIATAEKTLTLAAPCLSWLRDYMKFWIHDVNGNIFGDQVRRFFELE